MVVRRRERWPIVASHVAAYGHDGCEGEAGLAGPCLEAADLAIFTERWHLFGEERRMFSAADLRPRLFTQFLFPTTGAVPASGSGCHFGTRRRDSETAGERRP
jgi:hypothetical protein